MSLQTFWRRVIADADVAIDLGTAYTRVYALGRGLIADQPSAVNVGPAPCPEQFNISSRTCPSGLKEMSLAYNPLHAGVVRDRDAAVSLLEPILRRVRRLGLLRPRALVCAPTDVSDPEREALISVVHQAGASPAAVVAEPLAAALGAGINMRSPYAQMVVDIGDGVTDIAVIRSACLVATAATRTACSDFHEAVHRMVMERHAVILNQNEAARLTRELGAAPVTVLERSSIATGLDAKTHKEKNVCLLSHEVWEAIDPVTRVIVDRINRLLKDLSDNVACEVIENGICLTGGGAHLQGPASFLAAETGLDIAPAADPMHAVIDGAGQMLEDRFPADL